MRILLLVRNFLPAHEEIAQGEVRRIAVLTADQDASASGVSRQLIYIEVPHGSADRVLGCESALLQGCLTDAALYLSFDLPALCMSRDPRCPCDRTVAHCQARTRSGTWRRRRSRASTCRAKPSAPWEAAPSRRTS